jgi:hypothetical protein
MSIFISMKCLIWDRCWSSDRYSEHDRESITAILDLCQSMAEEEFLPCAAEHDEMSPSSRWEGDHSRLVKSLPENFC